MGRRWGGKKGGEGAFAERLEEKGRGGLRTLCSPVEDQADFLWQAQREEVCYAPKCKDHGEECEGRRLRLEAAIMGLEERKKERRKSLASSGPA